MSQVLLCILLSVCLKQPDILGLEVTKLCAVSATGAGSIVRHFKRQRVFAATNESRLVQYFPTNWYSWCCQIKKNKRSNRMKSFCFVCQVFTSWDTCDQRRRKDDQTVMTTKEGVKNQSGANKRVLGLISAFRTKENSASCTTASKFTNQFHSFIFSSENLDSPNLTCLTWGECRDPAWFWVWPLSATFDWLSLKRCPKRKRHRRREERWRDFVRDKKDWEMEKWNR